MKLIFIMMFSLILSNCTNKPKTVLICGDHVCINKAEANQYFKDKLSIEVKIVDRKKKNEINLVELNLKETSEGKKINIFSKKKPKRKIKTLSKNEITEIKRKIKQNKKREKIAKKPQIENGKKKLKINTNLQNKEIKQMNVNKKKETTDICTILEKCSIEEISKLLLEQGRNKKFPDITIRQ